MKGVIERLNAFKCKFLSLPKDKLWHIIAGMVVALFFVFVVEETSKGCVFFSAVAGTIKELADLADYGKFDWYDLLATIVGGLTVNAFVWI